jgi:hypothetical protein
MLKVRLWRIRCSSFQFLPTFSSSQLLNFCFSTFPPGRRPRWPLRAGGRIPPSTPPPLRFFIFSVPSYLLTFPSSQLLLFHLLTFPFSQLLLFHLLTFPSSQLLFFHLPIFSPSHLLNFFLSLLPSFKPNMV